MTQAITAAQLKLIAAAVPGSAPRADLVSAIVRGWPAAVAKAKLTTRLRAAHFLAQIMTETGGLRILEESGAYKAPRIMEIFGVGKHSAKITQAEAKRIAALPVAQRGPVLFNRVYGVGNPKKMAEFNNTGSNDGWLYRGGGMMQATGKSNYARMAKKTGLPLVEQPQLLHQPDSAFVAAYLEWAQDGRCNAAADRDDVVTVRKIINGGSNGLAECRKYAAKAKAVLADYDAAPVTPFANLEPEAEPAPEPDDVSDAPSVPEPRAATAEFDPALLSIQTDLKAMNYSPGIPSGKWGGMTAGAIAGFINDHSSATTSPASYDDFAAIRSDLLEEVAEANAEGFKRPVTEERASADPKTVEAVAPEAVPVKRGFWAAVWAAITTAFASVWDWISTNVSAAWDFFTDNRDSIPTDRGFLSTAWSYVADIPPVVWGLALCGVFIFLALSMRSAGNQITESVKTGARQ